VEFANSIDLPIIITDHHNLHGGKVPAGVVVVNLIIGTRILKNLVTLHNFFVQNRIFYQICWIAYDKI